IFREDRELCSPVRPVPRLLAERLLGISQRIEDLRQKEPLHGAVILARAALGDDVEDAAASAAELGAEQTRLHGDFLHSILVVNLVGGARDGDVVVLRAINQIVVAAWALAVDRELRG